MPCCGGRKVTKKLDHKVEVVRAIFVSSNVARQSLYGGSRVLGRPQNYGYRKPGDVFDVLVPDIIARPDRFNAYPCNLPFIIKGDTVEVPCGDIEVEEKVGDIEDIPGVGPKIAEKFAAMGIYTKEGVLNNVDEEILNGLPPRARKAIKEWQASQR